MSPVLLQAFTLTFLAEWGDRSQIATIAMAADYNAWGIIVGGSLGHGLATSSACIGGRLLARRISERTIAIAGMAGLRTMQDYARLCKIMRDYAGLCRLSYSCDI